MPRSPPAQRRVQSSMHGDGHRLFLESFVSLDERTSLVLSSFFSFLVCFFKECGFLSPSAIWPHQEPLSNQISSFLHRTLFPSEPSRRGGASGACRPASGARGGPGGPTNNAASEQHSRSHRAPQARLGARPALRLTRTQSPAVCAFFPCQKFDGCSELQEALPASQAAASRKVGFTFQRLAPLLKFVIRSALCMDGTPDSTLPGSLCPARVSLPRPGLSSTLTSLGTSGSL